MLAASNACAIAFGASLRRRRQPRRPVRCKRSLCAPVEYAGGWLLTGCGRTHGRVAESRADGRARGQIYDFCLSFNSGDRIPNWVGMASGRAALEMSIPFPAKNQRFRGQALMETVNLFQKQVNCHFDSHQRGFCLRKAHATDRLVLRFHLPVFLSRQREPALSAGRCRTAPLANRPTRLACPCRRSCRYLRRTARRLPFRARNA